MSEFDYQWRHLVDSNIEYMPDRIKELQEYTGLTAQYFKGKKCLDAGCGNGRYTWAMQQLGAQVDSFDKSAEAIKKCREINPNARIMSLLELLETRAYDFVFCYGVLHHLPDPLEGFRHVAGQVKKGGLLHVMVYHKDTQLRYEKLRTFWNTEATETQKDNLLARLVVEKGGTIFGWYDALNPKYNWGLHQNEIKRWFQICGFKNIKLIKKLNIHMIGEYNERQ